MKRRRISKRGRKRGGRRGRQRGKGRGGGRLRGRGKRRRRRTRPRTDLHLVRVDIGDVVEHDLEVTKSSGEGDGDGEGAAAGHHHHQALHGISVYWQNRRLDGICRFRYLVFLWVKIEISVPITLYVSRPYNNCTVVDCIVSPRRRKNPSYFKTKQDSHVGIRPIQCNGTPPLGTRQITFEPMMQ